MNTKRIYAAVFTALICFTACKHGGKDNSQKNGETLIPVLTKLSVAGQNFTDFSKNTFNVARTQEANIESVEVIAEAAAGTDITFTPDLYSGKWKIKSGINSLAITLNNGKTNTYIVSLTKKTAPPSEENPKLLSLTVNGKKYLPPLPELITVEASDTNPVTLSAEANESGAVISFKKNEVGSKWIDVTPPVSVAEGQTLKMRVYLKKDGYRDTYFSFSLKRKEAVKAKLNKITLNGNDLSTIELEKACESEGITKNFEEISVTVAAEAETGGTVQYSENIVSGRVDLSGGQAVVIITAKKAGKLDGTYKITLNKKEVKKVTVNKIQAAGGFDEWGSISYGAFNDLTFDSTRKKWKIKTPQGDLLALKIEISHGPVESDKVKVKLFEGTLKDGVVNYDTEKTKGLTAGTAENGVLTFTLDNKNCNQISIKKYYKIEFFIDGVYDSEALIELT